MEFRWGVVWQYRDLLLSGILVTIYISIIAMTLSLIAGLAVALARLSSIRLVALAASAYVNIFRAIPQLVFIIYIYYGLSIAIGINFQPLTAGIMALTLQYAAWLGEIFRAGIQAVPKGQREAALSVGMTRVRTFITIVMPQAIRIVIPPTGNMAVGMVKDSSLVSVIGVFELLRRTQLLVSQTFRPFEFYTAAVIAYLVLTMVVAAGVRAMEKRYTLVDALSHDHPVRMGPLTKRRLRRLEDLRTSVRASKSSE